MTNLLLVVAVVASVLISGDVFAKQCQLDNPALQAMPNATVSFELKSGEMLALKVKLADNARTRAAGFQRVCASTIEKTPILFVFEHESVPNFHMRNVVAPIDIAFIKYDGKIESIQAMAVYTLSSRSKPLYSPREAVIAALEVSPGFYAKHEIDKQVKVSWKVN